MSRRIRRLRAVRVPRPAVLVLAGASTAATGLVIATALARPGVSPAVLALLRNQRVEHVALAAPPAAPAPVPASAAPPPPVANPTTPPPTVAPARTPSATTTPATTAPAAPAKPTPSKVKHVFVIAVTAPSFRAAFGRRSALPYLAHVLRRKGDLLTGYRTLGQTALPDYLGLISGQAPNFDTERGCTTYAAFPATAAPDKAGEVRGRGCVYPNTVLTLGDQLDAARMRWKGYFEDLGSTLPAGQQTCQHPNSDASDPTLAPTSAGDYATSQNPFVYFHTLLDLGDCASDDLPLSSLSAGLGAARRTANLVYIAPGLCDDGSEAACAGVAPSGPAGANAFLRRWVPSVLRSPAYRRDGALLIVVSSPRAQLTPGAAYRGPIRTGALVISRYARPGSTARARYSPYSVLRSIEDLFALKPLALARAARSFAAVALPGAWPRGGHALR